jgi:hypothetical protein
METVNRGFYSYMIGACAFKCLERTEKNLILSGMLRNKKFEALYFVCFLDKFCFLSDVCFGCIQGGYALSLVVLHVRVWEEILEDIRAGIGWSDARASILCYSSATSGASGRDSMMLVKVVKVKRGILTFFV